MPRVRIERTDDDEFLAYRLVDFDKGDPLLEGLFVEPAIAAAFCRARRWPVVETVPDPPRAAVVPATEPEPPKRGKGRTKPRDDRTAELRLT